MPINVPTTSTATPTTSTTPTTGTATTGGLMTDPNPAFPGTVPPRTPLPGEPAAIAQALINDVTALYVRLDALTANVTGTGAVGATIDLTALTALSSRMDSLEARLAATEADVLALKFVVPDEGSGFGLSAFGVSPFGV